MYSEKIMDTEEKNSRPISVLLLEQMLRLEPQPANLDAAHLRSAVAAMFPESNHFHQHDKHGLLYRYPFVHYRTSDPGQPVIAAVNDAARFLFGKKLEGHILTLGRRRCRIVEALPNIRHQPLYLDDCRHTYRILTPLLPFNQDNYRNYCSLSETEKRTELNRLMVAHLLRLCKGLGYWAPDTVEAKVTREQTVPCTFKRQTLVGITGRITTNLHVPDGLAVGKAVSHGYGVLER